MEFTTNEIKLMSSCINNYIELANTQKGSLTVGDKQCATLIEFYDKQVNDCYDLQKKVNSLMLQTAKQH